MFFRFPPDARWNPERFVVEFGIGVGEYDGVVRVSRRVFQILPDAPCTRTLPRSLPLSPDPARTHRRANGPSSSLDRGWGMSKSPVAIYGKGKSPRDIHARSAIAGPLHESR